LETTLNRKIGYKKNEIGIPFYCCRFCVTLILMFFEYGSLDLNAIVDGTNFLEFKKSRENLPK
jgi:hypothetical protein